jgi:hypothetical protein
VVVSAPKWLVHPNCGSGERALLRHAGLGAADIVKRSPEGASPTSLPS